MISAVIIVLREVLEGVLLICMLMASAAAMGHRLRWLPVALLLGFAGAFAYAVFLEQISMLFEGLGQEIVSATLLTAVALILLLHNFLAASHALRSPVSGRLILLVFVAAAAMSMSREGAEIYLYVYAFGVQAGQMASVLSGAVIGTGIGLSLGTFLYYGLRALPPRRCLWVCTALGTMIGAGLVMQATYYLGQADVLPGGQPLWDSSGVVAESSLTGEMLQAALGYEATPTAVQVGLYMISLLASFATIGLAGLQRARTQESIT
jgi:high-affinity iron transporter